MTSFLLEENSASFWDYCQGKSVNTASMQTQISHMDMNANLGDDEDTLSSSE